MWDEVLFIFDYSNNKNYSLIGNEQHLTSTILSIYHYNKSLNSPFVKDEYVYTKLIEIYFLKNDYTSAINYANIPIEKYPFRSNLLYYKGLAIFNNKNLELSLKSLKRGAELVVDNPVFKSNFYALIGDIYHDLKNNIESDLAYDISLKLNPENVFNRTISHLC